MLSLQCGILPYAGVDICLFELFKDDLLARYDGDPPHVSILCAGMLSSSIAQVVSYPLALVRTRLQVRAARGRSELPGRSASLCNCRGLGSLWVVLQGFGSRANCRKGKGARTLLHPQGFGMDGASVWLQAHQPAAWLHHLRPRHTTCRICPPPLPHTLSCRHKASAGGPSNTAA